MEDLKIKRWRKNKIYTKDLIIYSWYSYGILYTLYTGVEKELLINLEWYKKEISINKTLNKLDIISKN